MIKKLFVFCILFVSLIAYTTKAIGQFVTVPTKISTPYGKVTIPVRHYSPSMFNNNYSFGNPKYKFYIVFLNDSLVEAKTRINTDDSINTLEWGKKDKKIIVKPADTKEIYRMDNGKRITGIPHENCWLFPVDTGKIKTYSINSEIEFPLIGYIQKGKDEPILPFTQEHLVPMVADNEKAARLADKGKLIKAINLYNRE